MNLDDLFQSALNQFNLNNLQEAEKICCQILRIDYRYVDALRMLGVIYTRFKRYDMAMSYTLAAIELDPYFLESYYNFATILLEKGDKDEALKWFSNILNIEPNHAESHTNIGFILQEKGDIDEAIKHFEKVVKLRSDDADAYYNLANAYHLKKQYEEALKYYNLAIELNPEIIDAYYNIGSLYSEIGEKDKAIEYLTKSVALETNVAVSHFLLGNIFVHKGNYDEAIMHYEKAISLKPDFAEAYYNLGCAYGERKVQNKAIENYKKAIELNPNFTEAYINLASYLKHIGKNEEAEKYFEEIINRKINVFAGQMGKCFSKLLIIYPDVESIKIARESYRKELIAIRNNLSLNNKQEIDNAESILGFNTTFYLPYQQLNDRELQEIYGEIVTKIMHTKYPQYSKPLPMPDLKEGEKIRLGIVSGFFYHHSNWKIPIKGWVENISRDRFEIFGYYTGKTKDEQTEAARRSFDHFVEGVESFERLCEIIRGDNLHILIYPEIGMDPITVKLSALRLAPVQCSSWGHPETSGLKTIDYFLSSELMEPPDGDEHYTEKLIRLPKLSIYYTPIEIEPEPITRESLGIKDDTVVYFCAQSLFKYLPQYDYVYTEIVKKVENCVFLFVTCHSGEYVTEQFKKRIYNHFSSCGIEPEKYVIILPRLSGPRYQAINKISDIFLDSIGWSGCNSTFEALQYNLPIVTTPGRLMRGRHSYAILKMMGIDEVIADSIEEYIKLAVKLGKDKDFRRLISEKIALNKYKIYKDKECINAMEKFFLDVIKS